MILFFPNAEGIMVGISTNHVTKIDQWHDNTCLVHLSGDSNPVSLSVPAERVADEINKT